jgi:hypothetical protein
MLFVWINKSAVKHPKIHRGKRGPVAGSDGEQREHDLPACNVTVDVNALERIVEADFPHYAGEPCARCFPGGKV